MEEKGAKSATLAKGLDILNVLEASGAPLKLRQIMAALSLPKPTAHRILATLIAYGLVRYDANEATYQLGMRLFEMARRVWEDIDLRGAASAEMARLNEMTGESIALALIDDGTATYIDEVEGRHHLRERTRVGQRVPLLRTAIGKVLAAGLDQAARGRLIIDAARSETDRGRFADAAEVRAHLDLVNARGYALELEEHIAGIVGVAAPILDHRGVTVAAIGLTAPATRLGRERLHELGPLLIEATRRASMRAGGAPRPVCTVPRPAAPVPAAVRVLARERNLIGESPVWDSARRRVYWVDICRPAIHWLSLDGGPVTTFRAGEMVTALAVSEAGLLVAAQSGISIVDPDTGARVRRLGHPEPHIETNRFNDGKLDPAGRFWVGTMALTVKPGAGSLYRMDGPGDFATVETGLTLPNGLGWSPDGRHMYVTDTADCTIYRYRFDAASGAICDREPFIRFPADEPARPDGLATDAQGRLWVALWDGWRLACFAPDGRLEREVVLPVPRPTSCAFVDDGRTLVVTSAAIRISEPTMAEAPDSGGLFAFDIAALR